MPRARCALPLMTMLSLCACQDQGLTTFNATPEATITFPQDGAELLEGEPVELQGVVSDTDHDQLALTARWTSGGEELCPELAPDDYGGTSCEAVFEPGEVSITLEARDPPGKVGTDTVTITVLPTEAPQATILLPEAGDRYYADQWIELSGQASDGEEEPAALTARWISDLDGEVASDITPDDNGAFQDQAQLSEGDHQLELRVQDSSGKEGSDSVAFTVGPANSAPTCEITAPEDGYAGELNSPVAFSATVGDVDIEPSQLEVSWSSDQDGELGSSTPSAHGEVSFTTSDLTVASHVITLSVIDEMDLGCTDQITATVGTPPLVSITAPSSGDVVDQGSIITFEAQVSDSEQSASGLALAWSSSLDGELSTAGADSSGLATFATSALSNGDHAITLTATDSDGLWAQDLVSLTVNGLPTAPVISISPSPATTSDDLIVSIDTSSTDPDGDPISYAYAWTVDGAASTASTSGTLGSSATSKGELWEVTVTPSDSHSTGASASASATIGNSAPVMSSVAIAPTTAYTDSTLAASVSATDLDGDTVSFDYSWTVDGSFVYSGGASLDGAIYFDKHDSVEVTVTPSDGDDSGSAMSSSALTILNSPPDAPGVTVLPAAPAEGADDLICTVSSASSDDDGDSVDYGFAWTVDGAAYPTSWDTGDTAAAWVGPTTTTYSDDTVPAEDTREGETWTCTVTPDDGDDAGSGASDSVVIEAPEADDYTDTWSMDRSASYSCAYGLVNINFSTLDIVDAYPSIVVTGGYTGQPGTMTGSYSSSTAFSASNVLAGSCTETYTITGTFLDANTLGATFEASFAGGVMCFGCSYYSTTFTATR